VKAVLPLPFVIKYPSFLSKNIAVHGFDIGAARAAYRLHQGLKNIGVDSQIFVQNKQSDDYTVIAPVSKPSKGIGKLAPTLDRLNDDISLSLVYAAADVFIAPSVQDNLPNTVMESLACGTPWVAFDIGGMCDMIGHQQNGYLAKPFDIDDLAKGIIWVLEDEERLRKLGVNGRKKVEQNFSLEIQANNYLSVYQDI
jgi:glycosyltransferase involved in cell wall biosynthesis